MKIAPKPKTNPNPNPNLNPNRGTIFLGGNCPYTAFALYSLSFLSNSSNIQLYYKFSPDLNFKFSLMPIDAVLENRCQV